MRNYALLNAFAPLFLLFFIAFSSCSDDISGDNRDQSKVDIAVHTRSTSNKDVQVNLPVHVYAFDSLDNCVSYQMLEKAGEFRFTLPVGTYSLYALCGAMPTKYIIPDWDGALLTDPLVLMSGNVHSELEAGSATVTLGVGKNQEVNLFTKHVVAQLTAYISDVPENVKDVKITLQPIYTSLGINGLFCDEGNGETSIQLIREPGNIKGSWLTEDTMFIFPSSIDDHITIGIELTTDEATHKYFYGTTAPLKANYIYDLVAIYEKDSDDSGTPDLVGTITGVDWEGKEDIFFGLDEDSNANELIFKPGDFYKDRLILKIDLVGDGLADLYLMTRWQELQCSDGNPSKWMADTKGSELITQEIAVILNKQCNEDYEHLNTLLEKKEIPLMEDKYKQVCKDKDGKLKWFNLKGEFNLNPLQTYQVYQTRGYDIVRIKYK